jgi:hypothetical protein
MEDLNPFEPASDFDSQVLAHALSCLPVSGIRESLVDRDDLRSVVGFQNDVNKLLGLLEEPQLAWVPRGEPWFPGHHG